MASTSPKTGCETIHTETVETMPDVCSKKSPEKFISPSKVEMSGENTSPDNVLVHESSDVPNGNQPAGETNNSTDDTKQSENVPEQPSEPAGDQAKEESEKCVGEKTEGSEASGHPQPHEEGSSAEADVEAKPQDAGKQCEKGAGEECGEKSRQSDRSGGDSNGSGTSGLTEVEQKVDLIQLDSSPCVKSPAKSQCAAV